MPWGKTVCCLPPPEIKFSICAGVGRIGKSIVLEEGDELAHRLAEVLVGHPLQRILSRWRRTSSKGGRLEGTSGKRHSVANQSCSGSNWVSAARAASRHCLRRDIGESQRVSCTGRFPPLDPDTGRHSQHAAANLPFENMKRYSAKILLFGFSQTPPNNVPIQ